MSADRDAVAAASAGMRSSSTLHAIINPAAGNGRAGRQWPGYARELAAHGYDVRPSFTTGPGDAVEMAQRLGEQEAGTILCVGGDGTANEIINGLLSDDAPIHPETRLVLIPCGTGKDLGRSLGTRDIATTIRALEVGATARIDVGRIQYIEPITGQLVTRYFANVADTGIGAQTAARINASSKRFGGLVSYMTGAVHSIVTYSPWDAEVEVDGRVVYSGDVGMIVFANGAFFAGGMHIAPMASLCDGKLDIFVLQGVGKGALLTSLLPRVYRGKHVGQPGVLHIPGEHAVVRSHRGMQVEMDGEQVGGSPVTVDVVPGVLSVIGLPEALDRVGGCTEPRS
jgi:YegS/Rv2252/BmrU family lipid kinase